MLHAIGPFFYCDPDEFPVGIGSAASNAAAGVHQLERRHAAALHAVTADLDLRPHGPYSTTELEAIWDRYKRMNAIEQRFQRTGGGYDFGFVPNPGATYPSDLPEHPSTVEGFVTMDGTVTTGRPQSSSNEYGCPICLLGNARIATPDGPTPIAQLHRGDAIWTLNGNGVRAAGHVVRRRSLDVGPHHMVVHVTFADGHRLVASPGHPLVDGREVGSLRPGERYDGSRVVGVRIGYVGGRTFDVLPSGPTGFYWADGVMVASTLHAPVS